ncbi:NUDIX domain-containing protein [Peterkaempfera sp. SMS 1(5)a]|uniref:NUDIX hydrolase n=1 Tax=Peterkaempfera podocarpi TaxID=3232308 RepID=UPI0036703CD4
MGDQHMAMPPSWPARIRALAAGEYEPVPARRAATVVLLRDTGSGLQAYLLRRRTTMAFAAGMYAFPGGAVDPRDGEGRIGWAGPPPEEWARRLGTDRSVAQAVVCAAVRETFEESGVLLAGPDAESVVADTSGPEWQQDRAELEAHRLSFAEFLARRGLVLRSDLLGGWARWITPEFEERRYDTWFFAAVLPSGQRAADSTGEADRVVWMDPAEALQGFEAGRLGMLPPTITVLRELAPLSTPEAVLETAASRSLAPVMARFRVDGDRVTVRWPGYERLTLDGVLPAAEGGAR